MESMSKNIETLKELNKENFDKICDDLRFKSYVIQKRK